MSATNHKETAGTDVIKTFGVIEEKAKANVTAEAIMSTGTKKLSELNNIKKRDNSSESLLGGYTLTPNITAKAAGPIANQIETHMKKLKTQDLSALVNENFIENNEISPKLAEFATGVAKMLSTIKKKKSADVIAAMYYVCKEGIKTGTDRLPALVWLVVLAAMFGELSKPNGFVKGGIQAESSDEVKLTEKDKKNSHLATLANPEVRAAAKTVWSKLCGKLSDKAWVARESGEAESDGAPGRANGGGPDNVAYTADPALQAGIQNAQAEVYDTDKVKGLAGELKPRSKKKGKMREIKVAQKEDVEKFLCSNRNQTALQGLLLTFKSGDDEQIKAELRKTVNETGTTLGAIINYIATTFDGIKDLDDIVDRYKGTPEMLSTAIAAAREKVAHSRKKIEPKLAMHKELSGWIAIFRVVDVFAPVIPVTYQPAETYEAWLDTVAGDLKTRAITVASSKTGQLKDKLVADCLEVDLDNLDDAALKDPDKIDRLNSLQIEVKTGVNYKNKYKLIQDFFKKPAKATFDALGVDLQEKDGKKVTEATWTASNTFDKFVKEKCAPIKDTCVQIEKCADIPPLDGAPRDNRLMLTTENNGFANFDATKTWFTSPTMKECDEAVKGLTIEGYLGANNKLLEALLGKGHIGYYLGIKADDFVNSWITAAAPKLGSKNLEKDKTCVDANEKCTANDLGKGLRVCGILSTDKDGYTVKEANDFVEFVSKNSSEEFCKQKGLVEAQKLWGPAMTGKLALRIVPDDAGHDELIVQDGKFVTRKKTNG